VRAYLVARDVLDAQPRWEAVERLDRTVDRAAQWELMDSLDRIVEATARWFLRNAHGADPADVIAEARDGFRRLAAALPRTGPEEWRADRERAASQLVEAGVPESLARSHAFGRVLEHAPDIVLVARHTGRPVEEVAEAFFLLGRELQLAWLEREIERLPVGTRMQRWALQAVRDDVLAARRAVAERALGDAPEATPHDAVERFLSARPEGRARLTAFTRSLAGEGAELAGLTLAVRQFRALVD
jgi:glutamate dehydrogenase